MTNNELDYVFDNLHERFDALMSDIRDAARVGVFDNISEIMGGEQNGMSKQVALENFISSICWDMERAKDAAERVFFENKEYSYDENVQAAKVRAESRLRAKGYDVDPYCAEEGEED